MKNRAIEAAYAYHNATKHSYRSVRMDTHRLDLETYPLLFKVYPGLRPIELSRDVLPLSSPALEAVGLGETSPSAPRVPAVKELATLLYYAAGVTRKRSYAGRDFHFRAAACTGALYEIELYVVWGELPGLAAGVYHFNPGDMSLRCLRDGDQRGVLVAATGAEPAVAHAPAVLVSSGVYWRNAWKYRARTYRHFGWDNGTLHANLLATAAVLGLPAHVVMGFADAPINHLLGLDDRREVALALVALGHQEHATPATPSPPGALTHEVVPYSKQEVDYPEMRAIHAASELASGDEARAWRGQAPGRPAPAPTGHLVPLEPPAKADRPADPLDQVILRRGSTRRFARQPITLPQLATLLERATRGLPADFLQPPGAMLNTLYLIVHDVTGLPPGAYVLHRESRALECLREGLYREHAGYLGLEQALPADASVALYFLADLGPILERFGNRGYRAVHFEAGAIGGRLYLAAYAQRLGATGLTFYDDDVTAFFSPHAQGRSAIFHMAFGRTASRTSAP
ncbi:MAG: SagB/ThcOx family dehydrogenase [Candidatus Lambdaproteobacteria bacterium]|nr:SagB/ThcOx family dehydrogenase [Candidatus Lambdaproteobacteria bacterium]